MFENTRTNRLNRSFVLCSCLMRLLKRSALARGLALVLLMWTAVDLTNTSLCALDQEDSQPRHACTTLAPHFCDVQPSSSAPVHVDDCFCCSHCVNGVALVSLPAAMLFLPVPTERASALRLLSRLLDHSPQLLS